MSYLHEDIRKPGEHQSFKAPQRYGNTEIDGNTGTARSSFTGAARMTTSDNPAQGQEHVENNKKYEYGPPVSETFVAHQIYPQGPQVPTGVGALTQAPGGNVVSATQGQIYYQRNTDWPQTRGTSEIVSDSQNPKPHDMRASSNQRSHDGKVVQDILFPNQSQPDRLKGPNSGRHSPPQSGFNFEQRKFPQGPPPMNPSTPVYVSGQPSLRPIPRIPPEHSNQTGPNFPHMRHPEVNPSEKNEYLLTPVQQSEPQDPLTNQLAGMNLGTAQTKIASNEHAPRQHMQPPLEEHVDQIPSFGVPRSRRFPSVNPIPHNVQPRAFSSDQDQYPSNMQGNNKVIPQQHPHLQVPPPGTQQHPMYQQRMPYPQTIPQQLQAAEPYMQTQHQTAPLQPQVTAPPHPQGAPHPITAQPQYDQGAPHPITAQPQYDREAPPSSNTSYQMNSISQTRYQPNMQHPLDAPMPKPQEQQPGPGARSNVDLAAIPSAVDVRAANQQLYSEEPYRTSSDHIPPFASTRYTCIDDGVCSPRFVRLTTYNFPTTSEIASSTSIPLGAVITPLAEPAYNEMPVPITDYGSYNPTRCGRCRTYVNPYFVFIDGGRKFICNICSLEGETPREHFMNLDMYGYRLDRKEKPEYSLGSYEFAVSNDYNQSEPIPASYVIAIDVSWYAIQSGAAKYALMGLKDFLYNAASQGLPRGCKVAIISYDRSVHFYDLSPTLKQPRMMVVSDDEIFNPFNDGFLVDPTDSRTVIENLLDNIDKYFKDTRTAEACTGLVVRVAYESLKNLGGKFILLQTMLPSYGKGSLQNRYDPNNISVDNERALFRPQNSFWYKMGADFAKSGICVDIFAFSNQYIDLVTTGSLSFLTGGDIFYYPSFNSDKHGKKLFDDVKSLLSRTFGYNALLKVRVSSGLGVNSYYGNFCTKGGSEIILGGIDSTKSIGVTFKHEHSLNERSKSFMQLALLYTTADGQRRLRVHNMVIGITSSIPTIFKSASLDTIINFHSKISCENVLKFNMKTVRGILVFNCIRILAAYRKFSPSSTSSGYLVLPDAFKLYPIYTLALLKSPAFRESVDVSVDKRMFYIHKIRSMTVEASVVYTYPRLFCLTAMLEDPEIGFADASGAVKLPPMVRASSHWLKSDQVYMVDDGISLLIWLSRSCDPRFIKDVFGVTAIENIDTSGSDLPQLKAPLLQRLNNVVQYISFERGCYIPVYIVRGSIDIQGGLDFSNSLVEDENLGNTSYADFLCSVHRGIQDKMYD